ncbi:MAG: cell division protein ZapA [Hyphomicrobiales bacterium]|uniref:cell division protein ZapA n=1 Tax=Rhabdaerophilum calidifontis TaxID=2604328 RepID=UPI00123A200E|nr:cell division protein ZapA [Rhabdaerophilum calidifontis]MCA1952356.1 cell division protein ZapA [Hyphomicrobiales bacterium]MCA1998405.1 cell division protein ZapA [Hyphomicrobiales bacterium]
MTQVTVMIDGKQFRMACDDGQEPHLERLAEHLDTRIRMMRQNFGEIGDLRLTVMAALMVCDELAEAEQKAKDLKAALDSDQMLRHQAAESVSQRDAAIAAAIDGMTSRVDRITRMLSGAQAES